MRRLKLEDYKTFNYFIYSLIITLLLLFLFAGMVISEVNIKKVAFGLYEPLITVINVPKQKLCLYVKIFGGNIEINFSNIYRIINYITGLLLSIFRKFRGIIISIF